VAGGGDTDRRGSAALLAADPRGSAGRGDAKSKGSCWPPRRRARQGERRPERETPTGGESGGRRGAGGPGACGSELGLGAQGTRGLGGWGLRPGAWDWESGTRGPGDRGG